MKYIIIIATLLSLLFWFNSYQNKNIESGSKLLNSHIAEIAQCE